MDKQLPAGDYNIKVYASDNLGNIGEEDRSETLAEGLYVEYFDPSSCAFNIGEEKSCLLGFHVCARNVTTIDMCMYKLGESPGLITPDMMNATISAGNNSAYVGLCEVSDSEDLLLRNGEKVNGKAVFNLALTINSNVSSILGTGSYDLNYTISAWDP